MPSKIDAVQRIAELEAELASLKAPAPASSKSVKAIKPAKPRAAVTYKQAMYLRFAAGLDKVKVEALNQGQASKLIAQHKAA